uniref:Uncharacterized protein n=1 Tax=Anguilla anguilla TaxID=7936 RepID=A0A0E9VPQ1_ANGAN
MQLELLSFGVTLYHYYSYIYYRYKYSPEVKTFFKLSFTLINKKNCIVM